MQCRIRVEKIDRAHVDLVKSGIYKGNLLCSNLETGQNLCVEKSKLLYFVPMKK